MQISSFISNDCTATEAIKFFRNLFYSEWVLISNGKGKKGDIYTSVIREFEKNYEILYSYNLSITVILSEYRIQGFKKS